MKTLLTDFLICPGCLPEEHPLVCSPREKDGEDIISGQLKCPFCLNVYPIDRGIPFLKPPSSSLKPKDLSKYENPHLLSAYLWSHYADLCGDADTGEAYARWAELIDEGAGIGLDAGCAVGRFTYEMASKCDFAIGIDASNLFVRTARDLMLNHEIRTEIPLEGRLTESMTIRLPGAWDCGNIDFVVGDIQFLPFRSGLFASISSLNLVDKVPKPLAHLKEMDRVARVKDAGFLFSDPFSWSSDVAEEKDWLGGTSEGSYSGWGHDNVSAFLCGEKGQIVSRWRIEKRGHVWWRLRNHRNHFELIRSCYLKASR